MSDPMLAVAERALRAAETVLQAGIGQNDVAMVLQGVRAVTGALELVRELRGDVVESPVPEVEFEAAVAELLESVSRASPPRCGRCGEFCSLCHSEALPAPPAPPVVPSEPSDAEDAVLVPEVPVLPAESPVAPPVPRALPRPRPDRRDGPSVLRRDDGWRW